MTTDQPKRGRRVQIYLPADLIEQWERTPRYERSATVAAALRLFWEAKRLHIAQQIAQPEQLRDDEGMDIPH